MGLEVQKNSLSDLAGFSGRPDYRAMFARYQQIREVSSSLNDELVFRLSKKTLQKGAKRLGLLHDGGICINDFEADMPVLLDYCIHEVTQRGRNAVDQYLCDVSPDPDSDKGVCLKAMQHSRFTMLIVREVLKGVGCYVQDMLTLEVRLLVDRELSRTARPDLVLFTGILDYGEFIATRGVPIPLTLHSDGDVEQWQEMLIKGLGGERIDPAPLIRSFFEHSDFVYVERTNEELHPPIRTGGGGASAKRRKQRKAQRKRKKLNRKAR